jgi:hypothetical protein
MKPHPRSDEIGPASAAVPRVAGFASDAEAIQALESFVLADADLGRLEFLLSEFNLFEAAGWTKQELRHSAFLAFLLDPGQSHGLGDAFLTRFLQTVLRSGGGAASPVSPLDLHVWDLDGTEVRREWQHIDILLLHEAHNLAVVIENKVGTEEHSDQLRRYHDAVRRAHPEKTFFGIYLTPDGDPPSHEAYLACSYGAVADTIRELLESRTSTMGDDVRTGLRHYHQMLHRHIMSESQIAELCRQIYRKHQRALDLIFEHRPDAQSEISALLRQLVAETPGLRPAGGGKAMVRFTAEEWDHVPALENPASPTGRMLYLEFYNGPNQLLLGLYMGPGPQDKRERLLRLTLSGTATRPGSEKLGKDWKTFRNWRFLNPAAYESASPAELMDRVRVRWSKFVEEELPAVLAELSGTRIAAALEGEEQHHP